MKINKHEIFTEIMKHRNITEHQFRMHNTMLQEACK